MKFWRIILPILILFSCSEEKKENNYVIFSGHLKNADFDSVYVILNEREKGFALDFDGNFSDTVQLNDEGYKTFALDREEFTLYLIPGDSLFVNADLKNFDRTFYFKGKGADRNNYLFEKDTLVTNWMANESLFKIDPDAYRTNMNDFSLMLRNLMQEKDLEKSFQKIEQRNIYFDEFNLLYTYRDSYSYLNPTKPQLPVDFINFLRFDLNNSEDYKQFKSYRNIVKYYFDEQLNSGISPDDLFNSIKNEDLQYAFIRSLIDSLNPKEDYAQIYFQTIQKYCKHKPWLKEAKEKMTKR